MMRKFRICFSPDLLQLYSIKNTIVIVSDILRATSTMTAGIGTGLKSILPVASVEECHTLGQKGYFTAGERGGIKIPEFDLGNSPFEFMEERFKGKSIAMTTTNGTRAISVAEEAQQIVIGSFLNLSSVAQFIDSQDLDVIVLASGWRGRFSMEDTLFGGALAEQLEGKFDMNDGDEVLGACELYKNAKSDLLGFIQKVGHYRRLKTQNLDRDFELCTTIDKFEVVPTLIGNEIVKSE